MTVLAVVVQAFRLRFPAAETAAPQCFGQLVLLRRLTASVKRRRGVLCGQLRSRRVRRDFCATAERRSSDPIRHYQMVRNDHIARAVENGVYFLRGNSVVPGRSLEGLREVGFGYGDSYVLNPNGMVVAAAGLYQE